MTKGRYIPALDGLRGIAIIAVMLHHYFGVMIAPRYTSIGQAVIYTVNLGRWGVDLFFVLSGFLITGILSRTKGSPDYYLEFYRRRALRIFPVYYAFLLIVVAVRFRWFGLWGPVWYFDYLRNWLPGDNTADWTLGHLWSLCVEEQFYLLWPLLVALCPKKFLPVLCSALIVVAITTRAWCVHAGVDPYLTYRITPARLDSFAIGGVIFFLINSQKKALLIRFVPFFLTGACWFIVLGLLIASNWPTVYQSFEPFFIAAACGCIIFRAVESPPRFLLTRPLVGVGRLSYGMYIFHLAIGTGIFNFTRHFFSSHNTSLPFSIAVIVFACGVTFLIAVLSWRIIETPFLALKEVNLRRTATLAK